jgi:Na+-transporting methylmalonyl-CoA/oxaloacetate decarboxylase gamma subunit
MGFGMIFWIIILILLVYVIAEAASRTSSRSSGDYRTRELEEELYKLRKEVRSLKKTRKTGGEGG